MTRSSRPIHLRLEQTLCCALLLFGCSQGTDTEVFKLDEQAVINGLPSPPSQNAVVVVVNTQNWATGVVVSPTLVLTSRHFLYATESSWRLQCLSNGTGAPVTSANDAKQYSVLLNNQKPWTRVGHGAHIYSGPELDLCRNDIALLEMDTPLPVAPLPLRLNVPPLPSELGILVGWGLSKKSGPPGLGDQRFQRELEVQAIGPTLLALDNGGMLQVNDNTFVTGEGGCFHDSGAPFISANTGAVVGLLSAGEPIDPTLSAEDEFTFCVGAYSIFRNLAAQNAWIRDAFATAGQALWLEGAAPPAATGESCKSNEQCMSGLCASAGDASFCTSRCDSNACPGNMQCAGAVGERRCVPQRLAVPPAASSSCGIGVSAQPRACALSFASLLYISWRRRRRCLTAQARHPSPP